MRIVAVIIGFLLLTDYGFSQEKRLALVIGNGIYVHSLPLENPENDAQAISTKLRFLDFDVLEYTNLNQSLMKRAIDDFGEKLKNYDVGLFFYAGHGVQVNGNNYLIPVDARFGDENEVEYDCVRADRVLSKMETANSKTNIVVLDACRNNPFEESWERGVQGQGLAFMNAPSGSLISYATSPGETASDGQGANGLFTEALINNIGIKNISVEDIFKRVRVQVKEKSGGKQVPWESTSLEGDFYFIYDTELEALPNNYMIDQISDYNEAIPKDTDEKINIKNRGVEKADNGDYLGAIKEYNKALELDPSYATAYNNRGAAKHQLGDYRGAIQDYNLAIKIDPEYPDPWYNRGLAKINLGDKSGACLDWSKAGELGFGEAYDRIRKNCN